MKVEHLRDHVIRPTLLYMHEQTGAQFLSDSAVNLLLGTAAQESNMGAFLVQMGGGPALGIYQMEPNTLEDIYNNYLRYQPAYADVVYSLESSLEPEDNLIGNLHFATAMARLHYYRVSEPLPGADDLEGLAKYYKRFYNTRAGAATEEHFIQNYRRYVDPGMK